MSPLSLFLLLATTPLLAQTTATAKHRPTFPATDGNWVNQQEALQNRARQILKAELSRKLDPACKACDPNYKACMKRCFQ